jgi:hypothetical protein
MVATASQALDNLRVVVILLVLSFHSVLAYLNFLPTWPFPIVDRERWFGFYLFWALLRRGSVVVFELDMEEL